MSTPAVATAIIAQITTLVSPTPVFNLDEFTSLSDLPSSTGQCVLVDFAVATERISSIGDPDTLGFEEEGTIEIHWLYPRGFSDITTTVKASAETLRKALRGRRIGDIIIESVHPFVRAGSPIEPDSRFAGFRSLLSYSLNSCG
jgi:hypothetical protein